MLGIKISASAKVRANALPSLRVIGKCRPYSVYSTRFETDYWVRRTLKSFSRPDYDAVQGMTRKGRGTEGVVEQIKSYDRPVMQFTDYSRTTQSLLIKAASITEARFRLPEKVDPIEWEDVSRHFNLSTSAGWSFPGKKKSEVLSELYNEIRYLAHRMKQGGHEHNPSKVQFPPCMAARRGKLTEVGLEEDRLVWVYPAEMLGVEGLYAPSLTSAYERLGSENPMLMGRDLDWRIIDWLRRRGLEKYYLALDIKSFDQTVQPWFIRKAFEILHKNINWSTWNGKPVSDAQRRRWANVWKNIEWYFINTPIASPDGNIYRKSMGVPSGSWFTQLVDSIVNSIYVEYLGLRLNFMVSRLVVLGDDSGCKTDVLVDLDRAAEVLASELGVVVNVRKSVATEVASEVKLLGFTYENGMRTRSFKAWMESAMYPDTDVFTEAESFGRLVGLVLAGGINNPRFVEFFHYFQSCWNLSSGPIFGPGVRRFLKYALGEDIDPGEIRNLWLTASLR